MEVQLAFTFEQRKSPSSAREIVNMPKYSSTSRIIKKLIYNTVPEFAKNWYPIANKQSMPNPTVTCKVSVPFNHLKKHFLECFSHERCVLFADSIILLISHFMF